MAKVICAGLGPGDPDLISLKAARAIGAARHVAYFRKRGRAGQARRIAADLLAPAAVEHAMEYPVTTEIPFNSPLYDNLLSGFYDQWSERLAEIARTEDVVVLCEGDPFFYGSFMHLHARLHGRVDVEVIPGIPGMTGCWHASGQPITWGDDVLTVLAGTLAEDDLARHMAGADAVVVMKTGRNLPKIRRALAACGRLDAAVLVEHGTMPGERVRPLALVESAECPYFAIVMVHGRGRRPGAGDEA